MPTVSSDIVDAIQDFGIAILIFYVILIHNKMLDMQDDIERILESKWFPEPREVSEDEV
jgi:hypothetical protein